VSHPPLFCYALLPQYSRPESSSKGKYRSPSDTTASSYGSFITRTISLPLRWMRLHKSNDEIDASRLKTLGNFWPLWKDGLEQMVVDFRLIGSSEDQPKGQVIIAFIHAFLVSIFTTRKLSLTQHIDSVFEQTALAFMIHPFLGWKPASAMISHVMRTSKNISRAVLIHSAFMGGFHEPYLSPQGDSDDSDEEGDEEGDEDDEDEEDEEDDDDDDDDDDETNSAGMAREVEPESRDVLNFDFMDLGDGAVADGTQGEGPEGSTEVDRSVGILA
jgi:hypothetical protein